MSRDWSAAEIADHAAKTQRSEIPWWTAQVAPATGALTLAMLRAFLDRVTVQPDVGPSK